MQRDYRHCLALEILPHFLSEQGMTASKNNRQKYVICIWVGLQLMCFALFLHPMNPEDFLALTIADPLETVSQPYGLTMAIGFWISLLLIVVGFIGWIDIGSKFKRLRQVKGHPLNGHVNCHNRLQV
jgi:hypothetical protein